jgi:ubiquitin-protein ligase
MTLSPKAVKRIMKEIKEYEASDKKAFTLAYDEERLGEFYAILRSLDGVYEGGEYILKIKLPDDYPFKPPVISCITPSGRFIVSATICLNISHYHAETWSPLITVEKLIQSVMSVFYDHTIEGVGSTKASDNEKKIMAAQSKAYNLKHNKTILDMEK